MASALIPYLVNPDVANPAQAYATGAQQGNNMRLYSNAATADSVSAAAAGGDKAAMATLYGTDYARAKGITDTTYQHGRDTVADQHWGASFGLQKNQDERAAAEAGRQATTFDQGQAAAKVDKVARVLYSVKDPQQFEQAKTILSSQGIDPSNLKFEDIPLYIEQAKTLQDHIAAGKPLTLNYGQTVIGNQGVGPQIYPPPNAAASTGPDDVLGGVDPQTANIVKGIADYKIDLNTLPRSGPMRERIMSLVTQYDPTFTAANYASRAKMLRDMTPGGSIGQGLASINNTIGHLGDLYDSIGPLNNSNLPIVGNAYNSATNTVAGMGGGQTAAALAKFNTYKTAVASELSRVFKGTGALNEAEVKDWQGKISSSSSPDQLKAAIQAAVELLASRTKAVKDQYEMTMGKPFGMKVVQPDRIPVLKKMGIDPRILGIPEEDIAAAGGGDAGWQDLGGGVKIRAK